MKLSAMDLFCWKKETSTTAAYTNILDFGTDGNSVLEGNGPTPVTTTNGAHGDDILYKMFWCLWCSKAAVDASLTVVWETSDAEDFTSTAELVTKTLTATELAEGAYPIANEPLPKGLKRFNRLKLTGAAGTGSSHTYPNVTAYIIDGRDEPIA